MTSEETKKAKMLHSLAAETADMDPAARKQLLAEAARLEGGSKGGKKKAPKAKAAKKKAAAKKKTVAAKAAPAAAAKKAPKKKAAKKKAGAKKAAKKATPMTEHAKLMKAEAAAVAAATGAAPKKKAKKKPAKKAAAAAAAPKKTSKSNKKKAKVSASASGSKKKTSSSKKKGKKKSISRSSAITVRGKAMRKTAIRAHQGMVRRSTKTSYENPKTGRKLSITHIMRMANPVGNWGNVAILGGGAVVGFIVTNAVDRIVATRAGDAKYPFYSHDAAHRIMLRPDGIRIAAQAGVTVAFFLGSYAAQNRMPKTAYFLAGAAIGSGVHLVSQLVVEYLMPKVFSVTKGNERSIGNRIYPMDQDALQDEAAKTIEAENKSPANLPGQQGTPDSLPDSYLYPTKAGAAPPPNTGGNAPKTTGAIPMPQKRVGPMPAPMHQQAMAARRVAPRIVAGVGVGAPPTAPQLQAPRPQIMYPQAGRQPTPAQAPRMVAGSEFHGEPVARAAVRTAPVGVGGGDCPGCGAGLRRDQDVHDGLNVKAVWPRGAAIDVTGDNPMPMPASSSASDIRQNIAMQTSDSGAAPSDGTMFTPGVQEAAPSGSELGLPIANNRGAQRANGRARGTMFRAAAPAGLAGNASLDRVGGISNHKNSLRSHLN